MAQIVRFDVTVMYCYRRVTDYFVTIYIVFMCLIVVSQVCELMLANLHTDIAPSIDCAQRWQAQRTCDLIPFCSYELMIVCN